MLGRRGFLGTVLGTIAGVPFIAREPKQRLEPWQLGLRSVWSINIHTNKGLIEGPKFVSEDVSDGKVKLYFGTINIFETITFLNSELYYKGIPLFAGEFDNGIVHLVNGDIFNLTITLGENHETNL